MTEMKFLASNADQELGRHFGFEEIRPGCTMNAAQTSSTDEAY